MIQNNVVKPTKSAASRKPYSIEARGTSADIFIFDDIGDSFDGTTAKSFAADLKALGEVRSLNIFINSPGGSVFDGVAIFNQLARHKARKTVFVDGLAASIASVIAMVGDEIVIAANGFMMIHEPWGLVIGTADEMRHMAVSLDKVRGSILDTYAERTGMAPNLLSEMMAVETWMDAEEAVDLGFADRVGVEAKMAARFDLSKYSHVPASLGAAVDLGQNPPHLTLVSGAASDGPAGERETPGAASEAAKVAEEKPASSGGAAETAAEIPAETPEPPGSDNGDLPYRQRLAKARRKHQEEGLL